MYLLIFGLSRRIGGALGTPFGSIRRVRSISLAELLCTPATARPGCHFLAPGSLERGDGPEKDDPATCMGGRSARGSGARERVMGEAGPADNGPTIGVLTRRIGPLTPGASVELVVQTVYGECCSASYLAADDKGKPSARRGRKATGLFELAGLPNRTRGARMRNAQTLPLPCGFPNSSKRAGGPQDDRKHSRTLQSPRRGHSRPIGRGEPLGHGCCRDRRRKCGERPLESSTPDEVGAEVHHQADRHLHLDLAQPRCRGRYLHSCRHGWRQREPGEPLDRCIFEGQLLSLGSEGDVRRTRHLRH